MGMAPDSVRNPLIEMTQFPKRLGIPNEYAALLSIWSKIPFSMERQLGWMVE